MLRPSAGAAALAVLLSAGAPALLGGCVEVKSSSTPTAPSVTVAGPGSPGITGGITIQAFSGTWSSGTGADSVLPSQCTAFDYRLSPAADGRTGSVAFKATCAGVSVDGSGTGVLNGDVLSWTAQGTATRAGLSCPFAFDDSTATLENGGVRVNYRGTVCGFPLSGSELLRKG